MNNLVGYTATVLTIIAFIPQTYQAIRTKRTRDLSLPTYLLLICTSTLWTTYGVLLHSPSLIVTNTCIGIMAVLISVTKIIEG